MNVGACAHGGGQHCSLLDEMPAALRFDHTGGSNNQDQWLSGKT
jgi:hypothetical protein